MRYSSNLSTVRWLTLNGAIRFIWELLFSRVVEKSPLWSVHNRVHVLQLFESKCILLLFTLIPLGRLSEDKTPESKPFCVTAALYNCPQKTSPPLRTNTPYFVFSLYSRYMKEPWTPQKEPDTRLAAAPSCIPARRLNYNLPRTRFNAGLQNIFKAVWCNIMCDW